MVKPDDMIKQYIYRRVEGKTIYCVAVSFSKVVAKPCIYHAFSLEFVAEPQCPGYACSGAA